MTQTRVRPLARLARTVALAAMVTGVSAPALVAQVTTGKIEGHVLTADRKPLPGATVIILGTSISTSTDRQGHYLLSTVPAGMVSLRVTYIGYKPMETSGLRVETGKTTTVDFAMEQQPVGLAEITVKAAAVPLVPRDQVGSSATGSGRGAAMLPVDRISALVAQQPGVVVVTPCTPSPGCSPSYSVRGSRTDEQLTYVDGVPIQSLVRGGRGGRCILPQGCDVGNESYDRIIDNPFLAAIANPLSTFSIDVDRAAYSNVRRFITMGMRPAKDAVRIEELINYFPYDYPAPTAGSEHPFTVTTEVTVSPWAPANRIVRVALQGRKIETANLPPNNLVFLLDVSGSMEPANKLPLVKASMRLLIDQLREQDRVAIAVYAGNAGLVLESTSGIDKAKILAALDRLEAGGSTAGGAGLRLAYNVARQSFITGGNNRVVLATDGDFNVGLSSDAEMERLIEDERQHGVFLTVLGFGMGNIKDSKLEKLADKGNGNYAYIDNLREAQKTLVQEMGGTLLTIAKDVKLQVEFNPTRVLGYRLIGYENRVLQTRDFADDKKDAGDMGAGHAVTALYEVIPVGAENSLAAGGLDTLRYQAAVQRPTQAHNDELLFVKVRYKEPTGATSKLLSHVVPDRIGTASNDFTFALAVAEFGMLLRESEYRGGATIEDVLARAQRSLGPDLQGYRAGFVQLVQAFQKLPVHEASR